MLSSIGAAGLMVALGALTAQAQQVPVYRPLASPGYDAPVTPAVATPAAPENRDPDKRLQRPLTPQEERDRLLQRYDPLSGADPNGLDIGSAANRSAQQGQSASGSRMRGPQVVDPTDQSSAGPDGLAGDASQAYTGPAVLSRGYTLSRPNMPQSVKWAPTLGFASFYNTGLNNGAASGQVPVTQNPLTRSAFGTQLNWGLSGSHHWKRDQLGLVYNGSANRYSGASAYNGSNHSLSASLAHVLSRRVVLSVSQTLLSTSQSYSVENQLLDSATTVPVSNLAGNPSIGIFDQGTRQYGSAAHINWQPTSRTSVSFGSNVFFVSRNGAGLTGATGYQSQAEVTRRFTRKLTLGTFYSHTNYIFTKHVSVSDSNTFGGILGYAFNRLTQVRLRLGLSQVESQSLALVAIDPAIAALLGQSSGVVQSYVKSRLQDVSAEVSRDLGHRRGVSLTYAKGLAPGNGLIQTSSREALSGGFSMTLFRTYNVSLSGGFDRLNAVENSRSSNSRITYLNQTALSYSNRSVQVNLSRSYRHGLSSNFSVAYQKIGGSQAFRYGDLIRISSGVTWGGQNGHLW